jgi:eukaryotic-like serine/threonine-protein kinase
VEAPRVRQPHLLADSPDPLRPVTHAQATPAAPTIEPHLAGRVLDRRYRLDARIGGGRVGGVYRATDLEQEREVAVRLILTGGRDEAARERLRTAFRGEARIAIRLSHPNLAQGLDYGSDERLGVHYLVTELIQGTDLGAWIATRGALPPAGAVALLLQAAGALGTAHAARLVHRDIRPRNLLVVDDGEGRASLRLVDLARIDAEAAEGAPTPDHGYRVPEWAHAHRFTPAADVYPLALVALELLTGRAPAAPGPEAAIALLDAARARAVPAPILDVLEQSLFPDPGARHADARAFASALERAAREAGVVPAPPSWSATPPPVTPGARALITFLAALVVFFTALAMVVFAG